MIVSIIAILLVIGAPLAFALRRDQPVKSGAAVAQSALTEARNLAVAKGSAGVRLVPDESWEVARTASGAIDPARPIAYSRLVPLEAPPPYATGLVAVHSDGWPQGFAPAPGRLVLEESTVDELGRRCEPTTWAWNVRVGDVVQYLGHAYTVAGPTAVPIGSLNPEGFVNFGLPGAAPPLDRGAGPVEWLYLTNRVDDDLAGFIDPYSRRKPGYVDDGWDGIDQDLDGLVDEDDEWEAERWAQGATQTPSAYRIDRRPIAAGLDRATTLPASVVIDATGWTQVGFDPATGSDRRLRSQVPMNPFTGAVDLMFEPNGRVAIPGLYGRPGGRELGASWVHLWIADRGDVVEPTATADAVGRVTYSLPVPSAAALVSLELESGRIVAGGADGLDPAGSMRAAEGGGR